MFKSQKLTKYATAALAATGAIATVAVAQTPPAGAPAGPTPAERAIEYRQAVYKIVAGNFGPLAQVAQGKAPFDAAKARRNAEQLAAISGFLHDSYPEISKEGKTRAKPEIWSNRAEFDKLIADFGDHTRALALVTASSESATDQFKAAIGAVGNDCKDCHENFRSK